MIIKTQTIFITASLLESSGETALTLSQKTFTSFLIALIQFIFSYKQHQEKSVFLSFARKEEKIMEFNLLLF